MQLALGKRDAKAIGHGNRRQQIHLTLDVAIGPVVDDERLSRRAQPIRDNPSVIGAGLVREDEMKRLADHPAW